MDEKYIERNSKKINPVILESILSEGMEPLNFNLHKDHKLKMINIPINGIKVFFVIKARKQKSVNQTIRDKLGLR